MCKECVASYEYEDNMQEIIVQTLNEFNLMILGSL